MCSRPEPKSADLLRETTIDEYEKREIHNGAA